MEITTEGILGMWHQLQFAGVSSTEEVATEIMLDKEKVDTTCIHSRTWNFICRS